MVDKTKHGAALRAHTVNHREETQSTLGMASFEISKRAPSNRPPPTKPHLIILPKQYHQQGTQCTNAQDYGRCSSFKLLKDHKVLTMAELWGIWQGGQLTGSGTSPRERWVMKSGKLQGLRHLSPVKWMFRHEIWNCRIRCLPRLVSVLFWSRYFLTLPQFLSLEKVMNILCHHVLEVCS